MMIEINSLVYYSRFTTQFGIEYTELLRKINIRTKDALHIVCSVFMRCDYVITVDRQLFNLSLNESKIINPMNFINELDEA